MNNQSYEQVYGVGLLDDIHNYFPAFLYEPHMFQTIQDALMYMQRQTQTRFNLYNRGLERYTLHIPNMTTPLASAFRNSTSTMNPSMSVHETIEIIPMNTHTPASLVPVNSLPIGLSFNNFGLEASNLLSTILGNSWNSTSEGPSMVSPSILDSVTTLHEVNQAENENVCSICQEGYLENQTKRTINHCHHHYHKECIDPWFRANAHCPVCRFDIRDTPTNERNSIS
jgi:hypothetical protein